MTMATTFLLFLLLATVPEFCSAQYQRAEELADKRLLRSGPVKRHEVDSLQLRINDECEVAKGSSWTEGNPIHILCVSNNAADNVSMVLRDIGLEHATVNMDRSKGAPDNGYVTDFDHFPTYDEIMDYVDSIGNKYPSFVQVTEEGTTHEGRRLPLIKIGTSPEGNKTRGVWVDAGIHAREWITPITAVYLMHQLVKDNLVLQRNEEGTNRPHILLDWYIMPLANPDGYEYTSIDRMWRKNRSPAPEGSSCKGVDLNRNFDVAGFGVGASNDPCSDIYAKERNSEPETKAMSRAILRRSSVVRAALALHSSGSSWLTSWGYKLDPPMDDAYLKKWATNATAAINSAGNRPYKAAASGEGLYLAGGASDDFAKSRGKIPFTATVEMPGDNHFIVEPQNIRGMAMELWEGVKNAAVQLSDYPLGPNKYAAAEEKQELSWLRSHARKLVDQVTD